jgi:hypothetical protein
LEPYSFDPATVHGTDAMAQEHGPSDALLTLLFSGLNEPTKVIHKYLRLSTRFSSIQFTKVIESSDKVIASSDIHC